MSKDKSAYVFILALLCKLSLLFVTLSTSPSIYIAVNVVPMEEHISLMCSCMIVHHISLVLTVLTLIFPEN